MSYAKNLENEMRRVKARDLRFKKPLHQELNIESMRNFVWEAQEAVSEIAFASQNDDVFLDVLGGDEDEAFAYRLAFSQLETDLERFSNDFEEMYYTELDYFDCFEVAISSANDSLMGYDEVEGDYFGIDEEYNRDAARSEQTEKLKRLTKDKLIIVARKCWRLALQFIALRSRYQDLEAALNIIRGYNNGLLQQVDSINKEWEKANDENDKYKNGIYSRLFDQLTKALPDECWLR